MTALLKFVDAAFAHDITGGPFDGVVFYIGGDAFHVWSTEELNSRSERFRLPTWVRSNPSTVQPGVDAMDCLGALEKYGVPKGSLVALDSETSIDPAWVATFAHVLILAGFPVIDYGSQSDVVKNMIPTGYYWGADWTGIPHLAGVDVMTQYVSFQNEDESLAQPTLPFWNTRQAVSEIDEMATVLALNPGGPAIVLPVPAGKTKVVTYADAGFRGQVQPVIRVGTSPTWNGGVEVDPKWNQPVTTDLPPGTAEVTFGRMDDGDCPVTVNFQ